MTQIGNNSHPVVMKNKKKGNRKIISSASKMTREERETYNKNWDIIFGKEKHTSS